jgi:hypothetical protein
MGSGMLMLLGGRIWYIAEVRAKEVGPSRSTKYLARYTSSPGTATFVQHGVTLLSAETSAESTPLTRFGRTFSPARLPN